MEGTSKRSEVARSISRISAALTIFIGSCLACRPRYSSQNPSIDRVASPGRDLASGEPGVPGRPLGWQRTGETPVTPRDGLINYGERRRVVQRARGLLRCLITMPTLIPHPTRIESAGSKPKVIEEYVGQVNTATSRISVAHMRSPEGWEEPAQTPEFDEYTVGLRGTLRVQHRSGELDVAAGPAIRAPPRQA